MKYISFIISFLVLVISLFFLGYKIYNYVSVGQTWGDSIFQMDREGNYYIQDNDSLIEKYAIQTYEGTILSKKEVNQNEKGIILEIESSQIEGKKINIFLPDGLRMIKDNRFLLVNLNNSSQFSEFSDFNEVADNLNSGDGIYLEVLYTLDGTLKPVAYNNFVIMTN